MIDTTKVTDAVLAAGAGPLQSEQGAALVEAFIESLDRFPDTHWSLVGVELPWFMLLQPKTVIVGVQDRLARDPEGRLVSFEWKSKGAPKLKKDGTPYVGDTEQDWLDEISSNIQLRIYALAMQRGTYVSRFDETQIDNETWNAAEGNFPEWEKIRLNAEKPLIVVRAVIKSNPPMVWPTRPESAMYGFSQEWLDRTADALTSAASQIRAARRESLLPWALPGLHCTNKYRRTCEYLGPFCGKGVHPVGIRGTTKDNTDPGWAALSASGVDLDDPDVVVLSASSYGNWLQCPEQYRILISDVVPREESEALQVGSAMHAGIAEVYRQLDNGTDNA